MRLRRRSMTIPPHRGQIALSGAEGEAVTGRWLSGCWATFIGVVFSLELPHLTPVYGRLPLFLLFSPSTRFTRLQKKKEMTIIKKQLLLDLRLWLLFNGCVALIRSAHKRWAFTPKSVC